MIKFKSALEVMLDKQKDDSAQKLSSGENKKTVTAQKIGSTERVTTLDEVIDNTLDLWINWRENAKSL